MLLIYYSVTRSADKRFHENLAAVLDFALPQPPSVNITDDQQADCGICYATHLPTGKLIHSTSCCNHFGVIPDSLVSLLLKMMNLGLKADVRRTTHAKTPTVAELSILCA